MQQNKIRQKEIKVIGVLLLLIIMNLSLSAQTNGVDSIKAYAVEFNSFYTVKIDEVLIKGETEALLITDSLQCSGIRDLLIKNNRLFTKGDVPNYNRFLLDLRILIEIYHNGICEKIGISPQGKCLLETKFLNIIRNN